LQSIIEKESFWNIVMIVVWCQVIFKYYSMEIEKKKSGDNLGNTIIVTYNIATIDTFSPQIDSIPEFWLSSGGKNVWCSGFCHSTPESAQPFS